MKTGTTGHKRVPSREGGIEITVEETALRLVAMGHQVDRYNRWQDFSRKEDRAPREYRGICLIRISTLSHSSLNAFVYSVLVVVRAVFGGCDALRFHAGEPGVMTSLPRLLGIPVVATTHELDWQRAKWGRLVTRYLLQGRESTICYSNALVVLSRGNQRYFMDTYGRESAHIPSGVEMIPYRESEGIGHRWGLKRNTYILFLSRLVPEEGLYCLLETYKDMNAQTRLVIAGEFTKNNDYVNRIRRMIEGDEEILFTDFVQGRMLEELMPDCRVYVLPSDIEGMPISLLGAMSCGVRRLISDIEENVKTAGGYARHFPKRNAPVLGSCLRSVLGEIEDLHDREGQMSFTRERYSWDTTVQELLYVYENVREKATVQI